MIWASLGLFLNYNNNWKLIIIGFFQKKTLLLAAMAFFALTSVNSLELENNNSYCLGEE